MAYDFFPKSKKDIDDKLKNKTQKYRDNCSKVMQYLQSKYPTIETPINIDTSKSENSPINVVRAIKGSLTESQIMLNAKVQQPFKIKFGDGSSGNRGAQNRGNAFEYEFVSALEKWREGNLDGIDRTVLETIEGLDKTYGIGEGDPKAFKVDPEGAANNRRPLTFNNGIKVSNPNGTGTDVGKLVTDVTVRWKNKQGIDKTLYLSLKFESTVTFFNVGIKTILTKSEIQSGNITNKDGLALLDLFKIDPEKFCQIFNGELKQGVKEVVTPKAGLKTLLETGIGHNYHVIHKMPGKIKSYKVDETYMRNAARPTSQEIFYGGKGGNGKRIDIVVKSATYEFKLNIRDTQGTDGYPTRMMCDFKYAH
ncbi:MAG: hypothetical protein EBU66_04235 [Bacteroidetes bacterium]|nr:hypothetical protein [bacterium]NBP63876.1 hypothetical protein [Bacteroidota bacterium]